MLRRAVLLLTSFASLVTVIAMLVPAVLSADSLETLPTPVLKTEADPVQNPDDWFFNYRLTNLAETTDALVNSTVGDVLEINDDSWWAYPSFNSASIGFATTKPTITRIEYGESNYTHRTAVSDSYYFNHLHYLTGLQEGTTYHYRVIYQDRAGQVRASGDKTFTTQQFTTETKLTNQDFPLQITAPGTYVLTENITSDGLGINIQTNNVTIDLNGFTLVYDNAAPTATPDPASGWQYVETANYGIRAGLWNYVNFKILNGTIKQGANGEKGMAPLFLYHMGSNTRNEVAGITVDYYSDSTPGMITGNSYVHHNVVHDHGAGIEDRHGAIRAVEAGVDSDVAFNSLRRFRHRGIDCGANCEVTNNELYSDSYATNSFAIGSGENHNIHDNKIFGMGYLFIGIGWGNGMIARDNLIYGRCYAPNIRSEEYGRPASVAGMRVTDFDGKGFDKGMLVEDNVIVLLAEKSPVGDIGCTMARGLWLSNGRHDEPNSMIYQRNTIKVEALPGNYDAAKSSVYYNGDVNNALATVSVQGSGADLAGDEIPRSVVLRDNHLITNVNHIIVGEGYGIGNGTQFYRTTLEKINHDSEFFRPVRLGFWYWNTLGNKLIDTKLVGISEAEFAPHFFGGSGKMDVQYGFSRSPQFLDQYGALIANQTITMQNDAGDDLLITTDANGVAYFEVITAKYYKYGNSLEEGGIAGTPGQVDYHFYGFSLSGYQTKTFATQSLELLDKIVLEKLGGSPPDDDSDSDSDSSPNTDTSIDKPSGQTAAELPSELPATGAQNLLVPMALGLTTYLLLVAIPRQCCIRRRPM